MSRAGRDGQLAAVSLRLKNSESVHLLGYLAPVFGLSLQDSLCLLKPHIKAVITVHAIVQVFVLCFCS